MNTLDGYIEQEDAQLEECYIKKIKKKMKEYLKKRCSFFFFIGFFCYF